MTSETSTNPSGAAPDVWTKSDALAALEAAHIETADFFRSLTPAQFFQRPQTGWSAAENVRHLIKSETAVTLAFRVPRFVVRALFWTSNKSPRKMPDLRAAYEARLKGGAGAGMYAPLGRGVPAQSAAAVRQNQSIDRWLASGRRLTAAVQGWSETQLDQLRFPHPFLGLIPAREFLFFCVFHGHHHASKVQARLAAGEI